MKKALSAWLRRLGIRAPIRRGAQALEPGWEAVASLREEVAALHAWLGDAWSRLHALEARERDLSDLATLIDDLAARVTRLDEEVLQVDGQIERVRIVESALYRVESATARQFEYIQEIQGLERRLADMRVVVDEFLENRDAIRELLAELRAPRSAADLEHVAGSERAAHGGAGGEVGDATALPERMKRLAAELARKEAALERTLERLGRVDMLATRAALTIRELEDQNARLVAALHRAEMQTAKVDALVRELETRMGELMSFALRVERSEERLISASRKQRADEEGARGSASVGGIGGGKRPTRKERERSGIARRAIQDAQVPARHP